MTPNFDRVVRRTPTPAAPTPFAAPMTCASWLVGLALAAAGGAAMAGEAVAQAAPAASAASPSAAPVTWGQPRPSARLFISGHSLTDNPLGEDIVLIANSLGDGKSAKYNQQIELGSPIRYRVDQAAGFAGYSRGKNRSGANMNVVNELRNPATLGGDRYDTLLITENHNLLEMLQWEGTPRNLRHFHERLLAGNPKGRTFFYESWKDIDNKADPTAWIAHERAASSAWQCIGARVNTSLAAEGRSDRILPLPAGAALATLVERATRTPGVPGISGGSTSETVNRLIRDDVHPTPLGMYYLALVSYAAIYERSPVGADAPSGVSSTQARSLQETAWEVVSSFYKNYRAPDLASCRAQVAKDFCPVYWSYRGKPQEAAGCTATFSSTDNEKNPLAYTPATDAKVWLPAP